MKRILVIVATLSAVAPMVFLACTKGSTVDEAEVVARVGEEVLTIGDLERFDASQREVRSPSYLTKEELMEEWVRSEVLYQNALKEGVDEEDECSWRLKNSAKGIVIQRFWELDVYEKYPDITDEEALAWYEENKDQYYGAKDTGVWIRRILLNSRESADDVMRRLKAGDDFAAIAHKESVTPEKLEGGSSGYRRQSDVPPTYRDVVAGMKESEVAGPFAMGTFFVIIRLEDRVEPGEYLKPEGIGMPQLRDRAKVERWREKGARIGTDLEAAADIERHPERIPDEIAEMALGEGRDEASSAEAK
ncbi:MAG TPA: peptidyl-prolyl cis-trans isomerase [bacterium]|nr:peptidyl-prolyl cis-trans isomerase [bacterium]